MRGFLHPEGCPATSAILKYVGEYYKIIPDTGPKMIHIIAAMNKRSYHSKVMAYS
jgi:hypothetical protein